MKEIKLAGKRILYYDSIDEMPVVRYQLFNKYLLIDSGVGSDLSSITDHMNRLYILIEKGDIKQVGVELQNLHQNMLFISENISPKYLSFCTLIYAIDNVEIKDVSEDNLKNVWQSINTNATNGVINAMIEYIKKKVDSETDIFFPAMKDSASTKDYYSQLKQRAELVLRGITGEDVQKEVDELTKKILLQYTPTTYVGKDSVEVVMMKQFEEICFLISQKGSRNPKDMTVLEFYTAYDMVKKQVKPNTGSIQKGKRSINTNTPPQ